MDKPVLVIMAAGMGSRYGGLKQIDTVDDQGDKIIDFSIFDAKRAGFAKVIFIIKKENLEVFKEAIGDKVEKSIDVEYVFQDLSDVPKGEATYPDRVKPYGTAHAVRACRNVINGPFAVINADDFYGQQAFKKIYDFLSDEVISESAGKYCMVGFRLGNTLTDNGSVSRGICTVNEDGNLKDIIERTYIVKNEKGAAYSLDGGETFTDIDVNSATSMNMWGFTKDFLAQLDSAFYDFYVNELPKNPEKAECYLPFVVDDMLKAGRATVKVLDSEDKWFGVTYKEDKDYVKQQIGALKDKGVYPKELWK